MDNRIEKIKKDLESNDLNEAIDKLDRLIASGSVDTAYVIERTIDNVENILKSLRISLNVVINYELPIIEKSLNKE